MAGGASQTLFNAVESGAAEVVGILLRQYPELVDARGAGGVTPLILATQLGHVETMTHILRAGADIEAADSAAFSPLMHAGLYGQRAAALLLIEAGAYVARRNKMGMSAETLARSADFPSFAEELSQLGRAQPEIEKAFWQRESAKAGQGLAKAVEVRRNPIRFKL